MGIYGVGLHVAALFAQHLAGSLIQPHARDINAQIQMTYHHIGWWKMDQSGRVL
jgi:hypothetical protein